MATPDRPRWIKPAAVVGTAVLGLGITLGVVKSHDQPNPVATATPSAAAGSPTPGTTFEVKPSPTIPTITLTPRTPEPSPTKTPEAPKPLPNIINKETVKFVIKSPEEVQKMIDDAKARGEDKIALPDILNNDGISLIQISNKKGEPYLAIIGNKEDSYKFPALNRGKIFDSTIVPSGTYSTVAIVSPDNKLTFYIVPNPSSSSLKKGDDIRISQDVVEVRYDQTGTLRQDFIRYLDLEFTGAPNTTIAVIGMGDLSSRKASLNGQNILTTTQGEVVLVSTQKQ